MSVQGAGNPADQVTSIRLLLNESPQSGCREIPPAILKTVVADASGTVIIKKGIWNNGENATVTCKVDATPTPTGGDGDASDGLNGGSEGNMKYELLE